jgi:hypothetical protein
VISVEDSPMDNPIPYRGKKVYQTVSAFAVRFPLVREAGEQSSE